MMRSILLPYSNGNPIQVFLEKIEALHYDGNITVNIGSSGVQAAYPILVTDATDAAALLQQINDAINSESIVTVITGNPSPTSAPVGVAADPEYGQIIVTWTALASNYTYNIFRSEVSGSGYVSIGSASLPTFTDTNMVQGVTYYYVVTSVTTRGESAYSTEVSATEKIPDAPISLITTPDYYQSDLVWNAVAGDALFPSVEYFIYRDGSFIGSINSPLFNDSSLVAGQVYSYEISAIINGVEGPKSAAVNCTPIALAAPTGVTCTPSFYSNVITWDAVAGAATYRIYQGTSSGAETLLASNISALTYSSTGIRYDTTYYYKVTALTNGGESVQSAEVSGQPTGVIFTSYSPDPMSIIGGTLTFTGSGFDPSQNGAMRFGTVVTTDIGCSYIDPNNLTINVPGGLSAGDVQFYYVVGGSVFTLPFLVAFS